MKNSSKEKVCVCGFSNGEKSNNRVQSFSIELSVTVNISKTMDIFI